jgi:hypothetical protein
MSAHFVVVEVVEERRVVWWVRWYDLLTFLRCFLFIRGLDWMEANTWRDLEEKGIGKW